MWRSVAIPAEHGGWALTLEPVLLGLLLTVSWPGAAIGVAAFLAFLVRTPLKLALVDRRRHRSLARTVLATRFAAAELIAIVALAAGALVAAGWTWLVPVGLALPLVAVELWFDVRSRSRRLVPELCGAIGIASVAPAIVIEDRFGYEGIRDLKLFLNEAGVEIEPVTFDQDGLARQAYGRYGRGNHPAALDYGGCFAYALAKAAGEPLLFKGDDFSRTDVVPAA